jgi:meso-butanediol dehydrogenase / (S,S)-butanediol dehydrogenase / diacetyl reductase
MAGRLHGKVAMITGGNSGIGEATARLFTQEGAKVAILARREAEGRAVQDAIRAEGREITFLPCDVTDRAAVELAVAQTVATYGGLHVLINNAGGGAREMFPDESDETWDRVLGVNLTACFLICRAAWPHLIKSGGGAIVNVSSLAAVSGVSESVLEKFPTIPSASYIAAKAGLEGFTRYIASLGGPHKIRANCVRPGQILTRRLTTAAGEHVFARHFEIWQLLKGPGYAEDVANAMLFLACDESRFITAEMLNIDGGAAAKL